MIKVDGTRPVDNLRAARARGSVSSGMVFSPELSEEARAPASVSGTSPLSGLGALMALQEMPSATTGRAKAARRGRDMLDLLDDVRDGLLDGQVSRSTLQRLVALVAVQREDFTDPGLSAVLDEIDLRARVELAKLNFAVAQ